MEGIASSLAKPTQMRRDGKPRPRSEAKRARIVEVAIRHFAERGYSAARVEDIAAQLGIAKGSVFQHFKSKDGLFFEAYKKAVQSFPKYMQAPAAVQERGFFDLLRYWLGCTENMVRDNWSSYRIYLVGNYGTDLSLRREINRFLVAEDPYGWRDFVRFGVRQGELRSDLFGDTASADDVAAFEDEGGVSGACEIRGSGQADVASADNDGVVNRVRTAGHTADRWSN